MKKTLLICFLASPCLFGSTLTAQVADSPIGQEGASSSALREVLIYGEIINPDSLGQLRLSYSEDFLPNGTALLDSSLIIQLEHGTFFDGVLDPRVQKFQVRVPIREEYIRLNLTIGDRKLLDSFFAFPGDSIQVGMDLQEFRIVFSGPQSPWFEAQYAIQRERATARFAGDRNLLEIDREALLDQQDFRAQLLAQDSVFGARIAIYEFGRDGLDQERSILMDTSPADIPGWHALQRFQDQLPKNRIDLLKSQLLGAFYAEHLSTLRRYHFGMPLALGDSASAQRARELLPEILTKVKKDLLPLLEMGIAPATLDLAKEWISTEKILKNEPLELLVANTYQGEVRDKILLSLLMKDVEIGEVYPEQWETYGKLLTGTQLEQEFESLKNTFQTDSFLSPATFYGLDGREVNLLEFRGSPTLLYFYYSGCTHSANYFRNYLQPFYQQSAASLGLQVIAVSVDQDPEVWKAQLSEYSSMEVTNLNLPTDKAADWLSLYRITAFPRAMLLDSTGRTLAFSLGGKDYREYKDNILSLLYSELHHQN
ncbi:thioredoxin family protein [uncultured Algoriphagus sp.]|uniref:TlpA family protein disulfide reductase n=1 Tax=uncultured Algoriphagus sp. TaxID=417365 RepID=UPI0030EEBBD2